jgi:beta-lactamase family protein
VVLGLFRWGELYSRAMPGKGVLLSVGVASALLGVVPAASTAAPSPLHPTISVRASRSTVVAGKSVVLSGRVRGELTPVKVHLYSLAWPYRKARAKLVGTTTTGRGGSFSFTRHPGLNTRYRATISGTRTHAEALVRVVARVIQYEKALSLGRAKIVVVLAHPKNLDWRNAEVDWWFAPGKSHFFQSTSTHAHRLSQTKLVLVTTVTLPAGFFKWRACFHAHGVKAIEDPARPPGCTGQGFKGHGSLPAGFPSAAAIARAESYLASRGGHTAIAVVDTEGRMHGVHINDQFITGSVVKAMLLVAYLRRLDAMGQHYVDSSSNNILYPMIHVSDNNAATQCWDIVGNTGLYEVAHAAGMTHFSVDTSATWGSEWGAALLTAHDQAKFFFEMDSLIPKEFVGYARNLLSHIAGYESWGIPAIARPLGYDVFFKAGWRPSPDTFLVHQIARLEKDGHKFSLAIMTDGDPDMGYGIDTIQGTTRALLG